MSICRVSKNAVPHYTYNMAFTNEERREVMLKVLYLGPKGAGKTTNLKSLHTQTGMETQTLTPVLGQQKLPFFEFLPLSVGSFKQTNVKLHIFAFSLNSPFETLRKVVFTGVDGFVFVADSRIISLGENIENLSMLHSLFTEEGYVVSEMPHVVQFNKRDEKDIAPLDLLSRELNPFDAPEKEAVATLSRGTLETLSVLTKQILQKLADP